MSSSAIPKTSVQDRKEEARQAWQQFKKEFQETFNDQQYPLRDFESTVAKQFQNLNKLTSDQKKQERNAARAAYLEIFERPDFEDQSQRNSLISQRYAQLKPPSMNINFQVCPETWPQVLAHLQALPSEKTWVILRDRDEVCKTVLFSKAEDKEVGHLKALEWKKTELGQFESELKEFNCSEIEILGLEAQRKEISKLIFNTVKLSDLVQIIFGYIPFFSSSITPQEPSLSLASRLSKVLTFKKAN